MSARGRVQGYDPFDFLIFAVKRFVFTAIILGLFLVPWSGVWILVAANDKNVMPPFNVGALAAIPFVIVALLLWVLQLVREGIEQGDSWF